MTEKFIQTQVLYSLLSLEPFILLGSLFAVTWVFYKTFLPEVSEERHRSLRNHFQVLLRHFIIMSILFALFIFCQSSEGQIPNVQRVTPYVALFSFLWGNIVLVKTCRLLVLQYLFLGSMRHGVPLLIVNMFSLLLSVLLLFWGISKVFAVDLAPLLATSAAFSIILGLAMQDTLGNLFAGISLQIDKAFEMGDWLEIVSGIQKTVGQVREMTWRSTTLEGLSGEIITLPNRFMSQAQIANFSPPDQPIVRSQIFRLPLGTDVEVAKQALEKMAAAISEIRGIPAPFAYLMEASESWMAVKLIYFIDNYGHQFTVGDKILRRGWEALEAAGLQFARQVIEVHGTNSSHENPGL